MFGLILAVPVSSAAHVYKFISAVNVKITPTTVTATGYNSASGGYFWTTGTFENYDPFSHQWGVLEWNPKGTAEGEWTSKASDADFSIDGQCKSGHSNVHLVPVKTVSSPVSSPVSHTPTTKTSMISSTQDNLFKGLIFNSMSVLLIFIGY